jgi:hypothetical protein
MVACLRDANLLATAGRGETFNLAYGLPRLCEHNEEDMRGLANSEIEWYWKLKKNVASNRSRPFCTASS